jgi:pyridoxamine 5'-phosphate oxidase
MFKVLHLQFQNFLKNKQMDISSLRNEYKHSALSMQSVHKNPVQQFENWLDEAIDSKIQEPTAMAVSTVSKSGFPQTRIVLLKYLDSNGFVFFTNYESQKGKAIGTHPSAGLLFFWPELERQVRVEGIAEKTSRDFAEKYFRSRPVNSQIGAWASEQSKTIPSRSYLEKRFNEFSLKYKNQAPPLPGFWGGYRVKPLRIEFWQGRENRLHDRILYEKNENYWKIKRLAP